jgi:CelD/BcsL family acetyltransferase involved in cellulose biosynthesis
MEVYRIDPTKDVRWDKLLQKHPGASIFHSAGWLEALRRTYAYNPVVFTTSPPDGSLTNGLSFCEISNWLKGRRLVSLPFSDHCAPLVENSGQLTSVVCHLQQNVDRENWDSVEIRGVGAEDLPKSTKFEPSEIFVFHKLDLRPSLTDLFQSLHKGCVQRKIKRAERARIEYESGRSDVLLAKFYDLLLLTRRRHGLPPQPMAWFRNLIACLGDKVTIHVVSKDCRPIASILTLRHKHALVYKYGCSDLKFSYLGGTQLLFWRAIQGAKEDQLSEFDLGRSDRENSGLVTFKDRWGAARSTLTYWRFPSQKFQMVSMAAQAPLVKQLLSCVPDPLLVAAGRVFYKYIG